jgi:ribonuclease HII
MGFKYLIGIDEAGRGPLAGPVAIGAVLVSAHFDKKNLKGVRDSKKLTPEAREEWYKKLRSWKKEGRVEYAVSLVGSHIIDTKGISYAIRKGIYNCLKRFGVKEVECSILLDGSLKAPKKYLKQRTIIGGDDKVKLISLASIAAKVRRDRHMTRLAKKYPAYYFHIHKGYGTLAHRQLIKKHGPSEIHRRSFLKSLL